MKEEEQDPRDPEDILLEEGREMIMVESQERNDGGKPMTFKENDSLEIPTVFTSKLPDPVAFPSHVLWEKWKLKEPYVTLVQVSV